MSKLDPRFPVQRPVTVYQYDHGYTLTSWAVPLASTPWCGNASAMSLDLTPYTEVRLTCVSQSAGIVGTKLSAWYSDYPTPGTFYQFCPDLEVGSVGANVGAWSIIPAAGRGLRTIRVYGKGGNGSTSIAFRGPVLEFR